MFYVCIIDHTNKQILYPEEYESKDDAARRRGHLDLHCDLSRGGDYPEMDPKADFETYLGEKPFAFPTPEEEAAQLEASVRARRDSLLTASDWTQTVADSPLSDKERAAWAAYRQKLRDVPQTKGFPDKILWPVAPGA